MVSRDQSVSRAEGNVRETHVDRAGTFDGKLIGRYRSIDDPRIGGQERTGWATYVYVSEPHTLSECPFGPGPVEELPPELMLSEHVLATARNPRLSDEQVGKTLRNWLSRLDPPTVQPEPPLRERSDV